MQDIFIVLPVIFVIIENTGWFAHYTFLINVFSCIKYIIVSLCLFFFFENNKQFGNKRNDLCTCILYIYHSFFSCRHIRLTDHINQHQRIEIHSKSDIQILILSFEEYKCTEIYISNVSTA